MQVSLLVTGPDGRWALGASDNTPLGWLITTAYLAGAALSLRAFRRFRAARKHASPPVAEDSARQSHLWAGTALLLAALGINKQLDLQTLLRELGGAWSRAQGWYDVRARVQVVVAEILVVGALLTVVAIAAYLRRVLRAVAPALVGIGLVVAYVAVRAAAMNRLPQLMGDSRYVVLLEIAGLAVLLFAAKVSPSPRPR